MYTTVRFEDDIKEYVVDIAVNATRGITLTQVLLDNQADISVMHPMLLRNVRPAEKKIRVCGVGGVQLIVEHVGMLDGFSKFMRARKQRRMCLVLQKWKTGMRYHMYMGQRSQYTYLKVKI